MLKPAKLAWDFLGNSITVTHAMFLMIHAYQILDYIDPQIAPSNVINKFLQMRLHASKTAMRQDQFAWYVGQLDVIELDMKKIAFFVAQMSWLDDDPNRIWPEGTFFHPSRGLCKLTTEHPCCDQQISQRNCLISSSHGIVCYPR